MQLVSSNNGSAEISQNNFNMHESIFFGGDSRIPLAKRDFGGIFGRVRVTMMHLAGSESSVPAQFTSDYLVGSFSPFEKY